MKNPGDLDKRFLNIRETSEFLSISTHYLYRLVEKKEIPHCRFGRAIRFDLRRLQDFIEENSVEVEDMDERIRGWEK